MGGVGGHHGQRRAGDSLMNPLIPHSSTRFRRVFLFHQTLRERRHDVATDSNTELVEWLLGIATTVSLALAGRSFQIHEGFDERLRKLEQNMISRQDLKDTMHDFQITVQRQEDRFTNQMEEIKEMIGRMDNKLEKHFDEERDRDKRNR